MYRKEIIYMGLYKDGSRIGNAGFMKVENHETESRWDLKLKNIPFNINGRFPIRIHNGKEWKEFNGISLQEGGGSWEETMPDGALKVQIQIMLPGGYLLEGRSKDAPEIPIPADMHTEKKGPVAEKENEKTDSERDAQKGGTDSVRHDRKQDMTDGMTQNIQGAVEAQKPYGMQKTGEEEQPVVAQAEVNSNTPQDISKEMSTGVFQSMPEEMPINTARNKQQDIWSGIAGDKKEEPCRSTESRKNSGSIIIAETPRHSVAKEPATRNNFVPEHLPTYSLKEDKWEQILDSYEQIHPYGDERVYVRLEPKDFIILQSKYQHLVNNSFLLHGFYNYRYVILGKENDYYLGVPGVFYEREKMVALMFGFEAFECPGGIARAGEFGYYLRKVEL